MRENIRELIKDMPKLLGLDEDCGRCDEDIEIEVPKKLPMVSKF